MINSNITTIVDDALHPYYLVCKRGNIEVFKKKTRKKADGTTEPYSKKLSTKGTIREALRVIVIDSFGKNKKNKPTRIRDYVNEYMKSYNELKKLLTADELFI